MNTNLGQTGDFSLTDSSLFSDNDTISSMTAFLKKIIVNNFKIKKAHFDVKKYVEGLCQYLINTCYDSIYRVDKHFSMFFEVKEQILSSRKTLVKQTLLLEILALFDLKLYQKQKRLLGFTLFKEIRSNLEKQGLNLTVKSQNTSTYYFVIKNTLKTLLRDENNECFDPILSNYFRNLFLSFVDSINIVVPENLAEKEFEYKLLKCIRPFIETLFIDEALASYDEILGFNKNKDTRHTYNLFRNKTELILHGLKVWISQGNTFNIKTPSNMGLSLIYFVQKTIGYSLLNKSFSKLVDNNYSGMYKFLHQNEKLLSRILDTILISEYEKLEELNELLAKKQSRLSKLKSRKLPRLVKKIITLTNTMNSEKTIDQNVLKDLMILEKQRLSFEKTARQLQDEIWKLKQEKREIIKSFKSLPQNIKESPDIKLIIKELDSTKEIKSIHSNPLWFR